MGQLNDNQVDGDSDAASRTFTARYDRENGRPPSTTVIDTIAQATGTEPGVLEPLFETLDPDALDAVFDVDGGSPSSAAGRIAFRYEGWDVRVHADGRVVVSQPGTDQR